MNFVAGAPLFACLFDQSRRTYVGVRIGVVARATAEQVEAGNVEFKIDAQMVYPTLAGAEARALAMNEKLASQPEAKPPSSPGT
jgi:hypothetical protein